MICLHTALRMLYSPAPLMVPVFEPLTSEWSRSGKRVVAGVAEVVRIDLNVQC